MTDRDLAKNPFQVGDIVQFDPSQRAIGWAWSHFDNARIHPGDIGTVTRIDDGKYIYVDDGRGGYHWETFKLIRHGSEHALLFDPNQTQLVGSWKVENGRTVEDDVCRQIRSAIKTNLHLIATSADGWERLYQDFNDGRYWELFYPDGEMQGGGPPGLRLAGADDIRQKYFIRDVDSDSD